jgi:pentatricopeptide repeat protein
MPAPYLPFLYQTRTILRSRHLPPTTSFARRCLHLTAPRYRSNDIPFARGAPGEGKGEGEDIPLEEDAPRGTITPSERQTFERIFADIASRGLKPNPSRDMPPPSPTAQRSTNLIMEMAAADAGQHRFGNIMSPAYHSDTAKDKNRALQRFPPSLRAAASRAFELLHPNHHDALAEPGSSSTVEEGEDGSEWHTHNDTSMRTAELDAKRHPEQKRVEDLMTCAGTDFELWDILEKEVFTYPAKLGLRKEDSAVQADADASSKKGRKVAKRSKERREKLKKAHASEDPSHQFAELDSSLDAPQLDEKLNLYIYGPLYPSFLLFGLRLLDRAFAQPSTLTLSVLPRIKELGLESFVLGVSTPFYNELLDIYYGRHGDLSKMLDLLEEMRHSGLYFDEGTAAVLGRVQGQTQDLSRGKYGAFATAFMTMPEYEQSMRDRIRHWHRAVDVSIAPRNNGTGYQELYQS